MRLAENVCPVHVFDSQQITLGGGLLVMTAVESHAAGKSLPEIVQILNERVPRTRVFGMIDTMESLRRGGRVSWAQFGIGTLLQIKPVMMISAGEINVIARVRTRKKALPEMLRLMESLVYEVDEAAARKASEMAAAHMSALKKLPTNELAAKRDEVRYLRDVYNYLVRFGRLPADFPPKAAAEQMIKEQGWDKKKR